ncbi:peptide/nickel transport system permease protein [Frigoribacterium sp. PhB107]|uniref:ABC transporter permease n=1 Tax=Frigoribacterium sp. PhB107 TaxID=2485172 RepID=UPI000F4A39F9|nr:ABC transporter permease [Frigoribacterium sp. PhB107]ROP78027.1 peptide/nickel transport system permease protein [Frigoribacterium sp. PhB107]
MTRFLLGRTALFALGLVVASVLIFAALRLLPGDVAQAIAGTTGSPAQVAALREQLGLDRPIVAQYLDWAGGLLRLDLGESLVTGSPVAGEIAEKLGVTLPLAGLSLVFGLLIGVPAGVWAAARHRRPVGLVVGVGSQLLAAVPAVWLGMLLIALFAVTLGWLPTQGWPLDGWQDPGRALRSLVLPALTIGIIEGAVLLRFTRSAAIGALDQDYVRAAAAKGMTLDRALLRHGLPNVMLSVVSVLGLQVVGLVVGAVVVEQLFTLPGLGRMLVTDVGRRDLTKVQGELMTLTAIVLFVGLLVDVAHRRLDPRLREVER